MTSVLKELDPYPDVLAVMEGTLIDRCYLAAVIEKQIFKRSHW